MKKFIGIIAVLTLLTGNIFAQNLDGYKYHGTSNGVKLYYKVNDYGISFAAKNTNNKTMHVKIYGVSGKWSDNRKRTKDVKITYIPAGKTRKNSYDHADNYSKLTNWSFQRWKCSENSSDF
jgi:hypothetical protein